MKLRILLFISLLFHITAYAQTSGIKYTGIFQAGLLHGASEPSWQVQVVNGVSYKTFSLGIGVGFDHYSFKTLPLFADLRKNIFDRANTPFVYADYGTSLALEDDISSPWVHYEYERGEYYDLGTGYSWSMKKRGSFIVSLGYTQKTVVEKRQYHWSPLPNGERIDYTLRRLVVKAGLRF